MSGILSFAAAQALASAYAAWRGGLPERLVGALLAAAFIASMLVPYQPATDYRSVNWPIATVDGALLVALFVVALFADRFWPMWVASCQLVTMGVHLVRAFDQTIVSLAYWSLTGRMGYLIILIMFGGTALHRSRLLRGSCEFAWTAQRHAHERATAQRR